MPWGWGLGVERQESRQKAAFRRRCSQSEDLLQGRVMMSQLHICYGPVCEMQHHLPSFLDPLEFVIVYLETWVYKGLFGEHGGNLDPLRVSWPNTVWQLLPKSQNFLNAASLRKIEEPSALSRWTPHKSPFFFKS